MLGEQKPDQTGSRYPAGIAAAPRGALVYVAENVGDALAVVDAKTGNVVQRLPTDHYPYAVEVASDGRVYVLLEASFGRPGPRLVDGVELLCGLLHPGLLPAADAALARRREEVRALAPAAVGG